MRRIADILAVVLILAALSALAVKARPHTHEDEGITEPPPQLTLPVEELPTLGQKSARVVVVEFSDYECHYCAQYATKTFPEVREKLIDTGRIRYAFVHAPAARRLHASQLSKAAICADRQGLFWEAHDRLSRLGAAASDSLALTLGAVGVRQPDYSQCLADARTEEWLRSNLSVARAVGLTGTPTFLVGRVKPGAIEWRRVVKGAHSYHVLSEVVEEVSRRWSWLPFF